MAKIDTNKFIPQNRTENRGLSSQRVSVSSGVSSGSTPNINPSDVKPEGNENQSKKTLLSEVIEIRKNLLLILKLVKGNNSLLKKSEERQRKEQEQQKFQEKELKSEEKKNKLIPDFKPTEFPKMGFLDRIKQFLFYTVLGAAFTKFGKHIPQVLGLLKNLGPAFTTFENITGNILNGFVDFVGFGYKAYDKVKEIIVGISGDDTEKRLQEFDKQFNTFANLALIAGMTAAGSADFSGGGGKKERLGVDKQTGQRVSKRAQARYLNQYGQDAYIKKFGKRSFTGLTGKAPSRFAGRLAGKALGKVPIIGGLVDFIISTVIFKEKPGRAAAKAVGATIGSALGTFVPVPFAGTILGGILGDIVGGALYDSLVGGDKLKAKAQGGQATRGGKRVSAPIKRTIKRTRPKPTKIKPQKTIPGKDVGGREEIKKLFPSPTNPRQKNPLGTLENASKNYKERVPLIGGIMGAAIDSTMGQRPDPTTFKRIGTGFGHLIQNAIDAETNGTIAGIQNQIVGLAAGGMVPRTLSTNENIGMKIGESIGKALEAMVNSQVNNTLQSIRQQFTKEDYMTPGGGAPDGGGGAGGGMLPGDAPPEVKAALEAIAGAEGGWDSVNPGKVVTGLRNMTIAQAREVGMNQRAIAGSGALGKFQQLPVYNGVNILKQRAEAAGLNYERDKFNEENQTKIARAYIAGIYPGGEVQLIQDARKDPMILANKLKGVYPSLPGGSQPNVHTSGYLSRYQQSLEKYKVTLSHGRIPKADYIKGVLDESGEPGFDVTWKGNNNIAILPGKVKEVGKLYGSGYGNVVVVESIDPVNGKKVDVLYSHFPDGGISVTPGQQVNTGQVLGRMGKPGEPGIGNITGQHASIDFYEHNKNSKYSRWQGLSREIINSAKTGSNLSNRPTPTPKSDTRPQSPPPAQVRTKPTRPSWTPAGLEKLPDGTYRKRASLAPSTSPKIASGLNQETTYGGIKETIIARLPIPIPQPTLIPTGGGIVNNIASTQSFNQTQATLANA